MSTTVDNRVVEMSFDNKQFESGVQTSLKTLDNLNRSLDMTESARKLNVLGSAIKNISFDGLAYGADYVKVKVSALQTFMFTAVQDLTRYVEGMAKRMISALSIDPIKSGFQEYETQLGAVQTILANTAHEGTNLQQVNRALDELNLYADKTIYNFTEMTRNIGTFTAAGVSLRTSVDSIKGIANLAAVSGSTSQQASTAMYQLSQALAAGKVSLMDWNSVVNAGMGGKVFQDALIRTSELLETGANNAIEKYGSFRESLTQGEWLTTEVLTETLKQFAGAYSEADLIQQGFTETQAKEIAAMAKTAEDAATKVKTISQLIDTLKESAQSGWTSTWQIIVGDFEEAKATLTEASQFIGDIISNAAEARNKILSSGLSTGWKQLLSEGIADEAGYIDTIQEVAKETSDDFEKMVADSESFGDALKRGLSEGIISSETLGTAIVKLQEKMSSMSSDELKAAGYTREMVDSIESLSKGVQDGSVSIDEFVNKIIRPSGRENLIDALWTSAKHLVEIIGKVKEGFREMFPPITGDQLYQFTATLKELSEKLKLSDTAMTNLKITFKGLFAVIDIVKQAFMAVVHEVAPLTKGTGTLVENVLKLTASFSKWILNLDQTIEESKFFENIVGRVTSVIRTLSNYFAGPLRSGFENVSAYAEKFMDVLSRISHSDFVTGMIERITIRFNSLVDVVKLMGTDIRKAFDAIGDYLMTSGFVAALQFIWNTIKDVSKWIGNTIKELFSYINRMVGNVNFSGAFDIASGAGIGMIALSIKKFIDTVSDALDGDGDGLVGKLTDLLDGLGDTLGAIQAKVKSDVLMSIAKALAVLVGSLVVLSLVDSSKLATAMTALAGLFGELAIAMSMMDDLSGGKGAIKTATTMTIISGALLIMSGAVAIMSSVDWNGLAKGLVGVGVLLGEMFTFMKFAKFDKNAGKHALGIVMIAGAIRILAGAVTKFQDMSWEQLGKGLAGIGGLLLEVAAFTNLTGGAKHVVSTGLSLIAIATGMLIFGKAMSSMGNIPIDTIKNGLIGIAGALTFVSIAANTMPDGMISKGLGVIAIASSLLILAQATKAFGGMDLDKMGQGLGGIGAAMLIMAIGLNSMTGTLAGSAALVIATVAVTALVPAILALSAIPIENLFKSLGSLAAVFAILGVSAAVLAPLVPVILSLSGSLLAISGASLAIGASLALIGVGLSAIATGFTMLATAGAAGATSFVATLVVIVDGVANLITSIVSAIAKGIVTFLDILAQCAPSIGKAVVSILTTVVTLVVESSSTIIEQLGTLIENVLATIAEHGPEILQSVFDILIGILTVIADNIGRVVEAGVDIVVGFIEGISQKLPDVIQAGFELLISFIDGVTDAINNNSETLAHSMSGLIRAMITGGITVVTTMIGDFLSAGKDLMDSGFIKGIADKASDFASGVLDLVRDAKDKVLDKIDEWVDVGKNIVKGLVKGIKDNALSVWDEIKSVARRGLDSAEEFLGINSPSKEFAIIGRYSDMGWAKGVSDFGKLVVGATKGIGAKAVDSASYAFGDMRSAFDSNSNLNPHIHPVVDLTDVERGASEIDQLLSGTSSRNVNAYANAQRTAKILARTNTDVSSRSIDKLTKAVTKLINNPTSDIKNEFNIVSNNPEEVAEEVSRVILRQMNRRESAWA